MRSRVYATVCCPSVRLSVPSVDRSSGVRRRVCCWALCRQTSIDIGGRWADVLHLYINICVRVFFLFYVSFFIISCISVILVMTLSLYCALVLAVFVISVYRSVRVQYCTRNVHSWYCILISYWLHRVRVMENLTRLNSTRSTQPCIPPGSLNRVPASAGVRAGTSPLPGGRYM